MLILLSFLVSIDSFFISSLISGKTRNNIVLLVSSPVFHTILCFTGIMLHKNIIPPYTNHLILLYVLVVLMIFSGIYLVAVYNPQKQIASRGLLNKFISIKSVIIIILILFCSFDAIVAGIVFTYWHIPVIKSLFSIFSINLILVLIPIIFKKIQSRIYDRST